MSEVAKVKFVNYKESIFKALDLIKANNELKKQTKIILKPNLITNKNYPITTNVKCLEAIIQYCLENSKAEIIIAEGTGDSSTTTEECYDQLGYKDLEKYNVKLIDLNKEETILLKNENALTLKKFKLPKILQNSFLISVPVLKDHSMAGVTLSLKNMLGIMPSISFGMHFRKWKAHVKGLSKSIVDINTYKKINLSVIDAFIGLKNSHLNGTPYNFNLILASFDPVATDVIGAELLGHNWNEIEHIRLANNKLGNAENIRILE